MPRFAKTYDHKGITLRLIGEWADMAAYYEGSDGNAWSFSASVPGARPSNCGPIAEFRATFASRRRGQLFDQGA